MSVSTRTSEPGRTFEVTIDNFQIQVEKSDVPVLLDFTAEWCPPCKMIAPYLNEIADKYAGRLRVGKLDADTQIELVRRFEVMGMPTLVLIRGGVEVRRMVGFRPRSDIEAKIAPYLTD